MNEAKAREPWITKNKIYFAFKKFCLKRNLEETDDSSKSVATINKPCTGGRPKGSTIVNQYHHKETLAATKNETFALYQNEKKEQNKNGGKRLAKGWFKKTIERVCNSRGLPPTTAISVKSIRKRTKPLVLTEQGCETLMYQVELQLVTLILAMAQAWRCLQASKYISLANDLIKGTEPQKK